MKKTLDHTAILDNRAELDGTPPLETGAECCNQHLVFALQDKHHRFSLGLETVLQCLRAAEQEGAVPALPDAWWLAIANRFHTRLK